MKPHTPETKQDIKDTPANPSREEAEKAVETLIRWAGEDPSAEGLEKTPARVVRAFEEHFAGYREDPDTLLGPDFEPAEGYKDYVSLTHIPVYSHCRHHLHPILGHAHIAYWPGNHLAGLSKIARVVQSFCKKMVSQESLTTDIRDCLDRNIKPQGCAVIIEARHLCITTRGVKSPDIQTRTASYSGIFDQDEQVRQRFLSSLK